MAEHLDNLNAIVRELVVRRYKPADIKKIEAGEYGDVNEIPADEDPEFQSQYQRNRCARMPCNSTAYSSCGVQMCQGACTFLV